MSDVRKPILPRCSKRFSPGMQTFSPSRWSIYFENQKEVVVESDVFTVYSSGNKGPVLVLLHGGGYSALTWALFGKEIRNRVDCQICAIDLRGHGNSKAEDEENLSLDVLVEDIVTIAARLFCSSTPVVLIGHSLGGAIAVSAASLIPNVVGICVIDVVEGTAIKALPSMKNVLQSRPSSFSTIQQAIEWSFKDGQMHNLEAAQISMPGQIKNILTNQLAAEECQDVERLPTVTSYCNQPAATSLKEEEEEKEEENHDSFEEQNESISENTHEDAKTSSSTSSLYTWRIDLNKTERFWSGWFKDLSQKFLRVNVPKILLLANINRLDTALTVGQMQGKFQLQVLPQSGHAIHESQPQRVADVVARFLIKHELALSKNNI